MIDFILKCDDGVEAKLESILDGLASASASSEQRLDSLNRLEILFGRAVLTNTEGSGTLASAWWSAQERPSTCVASALVPLLHRLHLVASLRSHTSKSSDPTDEMTATLTILQGLCLKDRTSRAILSRKSTLELILDIVQASYWQHVSTDSPAIVHAVDLLICVTMSSVIASQAFDTLQGEDSIRAMMERYARQSTSSMPRLVTLDDVQDSAIAMKCAECLLLYASERDEAGNRTVDAGHTSAYLDTSVVHHFARKHAVRWQHREEEDTCASSTVKNRSDGVLQRSRRARSISPVKLQGTARKIRSRPALEKPSALRSPSKPLTSPARSFPPPRTATRDRLSSRRLYYLTGARSGSEEACSTPVQSRTPSSNERTPFAKRCSMEETVRDGSSLLVPRSPLKAIIGPSPAVLRAQMRSVSPDKGR